MGSVIESVAVTGAGFGQAPNVVFQTQVTPGGMVEFRLDPGDVVQLPDGRWWGPVGVPVVHRMLAPRNGRILANRYLFSVVELGVNGSPRPSHGRSQFVMSPAVNSVPADTAFYSMGTYSLPLEGWDRLCFAFVPVNGTEVDGVGHAFKARLGGATLIPSYSGAQTAGTHSSLRQWFDANSTLAMGAHPQLECDNSEYTWSNWYSNGFEPMIMAVPWPTRWPRYGGEVSLSLDFSVAIGATAGIDQWRGVVWAERD